MKLLIKIFIIIILMCDTVLANKLPPLVEVLIIGAGSAGLTAAINTSRAQYETIIFTGKEPGGQLMQAHFIENFPGQERIAGKFLIEKIKQQALKFGAIIIPETIIDIDCSTWPFQVRTENNEQIAAFTIIIACGGTQKKLSIPGVEQYWGKGIKVCVICDAPFDKDKLVAVIGEDDMAVDKALRLASFAKKVFIISPNKKMNITAKLQEYLNETPNIEIVLNTEITQILGDDEKITGLRMLNKGTNANSNLAIQSIYFALGFIPNSHLFKDKIDIDEKGYIKTIGKTQQTSIPGIFAAGTVEESIYQKATIACAHGMSAALDAIHFLEQLPNDLQFKHISKAPYYKFPYKNSETISLITSLEECREHIASHDNLVVLDFFINGCPACMQMAPIIETVAQQYKDTVYFMKVDYEQSQDIADFFMIEQVPALLFFKQGLLIHKIETTISRKDLLEEIKHYV